MKPYEVQAEFTRIQSMPDEVKCEACLGWGTLIQNKDGDWLYRDLEECKDCSGTGLRPVPKNEMKQ